MRVTFYCSVKFRSCPEQGGCDSENIDRCCPGDLSPLCTADGWGHVLCNSMFADMGPGWAVLQQGCSMSFWPPRNSLCQPDAEFQQGHLRSNFHFVCFFFSPSLTVRECDLPHYSVIPGAEHNNDLYAQH